MRLVARATRIVAALVPLCALTVLSLSLTGCGGSDNPPANTTRTIAGRSQTVAGATVTTWANVNSSNTVQEVGVTIPYSLIANPPALTATRATRHAVGGTGDDSHEDSDEISQTTSNGGTEGPAGSFIFVEFPDEVKKSTFLNHFEMHWNPNGHPPARYAAPHFDFHFYHSTLAEVAAITAPDTIAADAQHVPAGYVYPGVQETVPQMGVHAVAASEFAPGAAPFSASMVLGYYRGVMHFVEPMITQERLLTKEPIELTVPRPEVLGEATRYPTRFIATYDPKLDAYQCVFTDFVNVAK